MARRKKQIADTEINQEEAQKQAAELAKVKLPAPSSTEIVGQQSAMIPSVIIPPDLKAEGYDMGTAYIVSNPSDSPHLEKGEQFFVKTIHEKHARHAKVVHAKSLRHFWEGTVKDFKAEFERA